MQFRWMRTLVAALSAITLLAVTGCGDDDTTDDATQDITEDTADSEDTADPGDDATEDTADTTEETTDDTTEDTTADTTEETAAGDGDFCGEVEATAAQASFDPSDPDYDLDVVAGLFRATTPPGEIGDDWELTLRVFDSFDDPDAGESDPIDFDELDAATRRIEAFVLDECGVDISPGS